MRTIKSNRLSLVLLGIFSLTLVPSLSIAKSQEDQVLFKNRMTGRHVLSENDVGVGINFSDQEAEEAQRYWTPERIASAISLDSEQDSNAQKSVKEYLEENKINNQGNYEAVYWIGRIYFDAGGHQYSCTGASIESNSKSVVATAAHCLYYMDGEWSTRVVFVPAWDGVNKPLLTWGAVYYQIPRAWRYEEDREHDAAFIKFKPLNDWYGKKEYLADKAGAQTPSFSLAKSGLHYQAFGYKNLSGFNNTPLFICSGEGSDFQKTATNRRLQISGCTVPGGSSGGPVYHASKKGPNGTQVGVVTQQRKAKDGTPLLVFVPWGEVEYSIYRTVDDFGR
ncbi:trypsin-like serine peptidase [Xylella fastidiosa]|uniref:trypsin-like serine peptidase n=1 Tax=Xylella fastidiosa TaxID=2371 RepID=UPI000FE357B3|nr:peptidase [Xylella fastidiosa]MRT34924.1 peptidase [Xylella fastidiosa subsp. multiplex]MRT46573.1 peptidase [Xylella fastidiosa subsp. multiplex]MRT96779.1 peptidase [Xylella fastidiosa subsp. multiplex]MRU29170.1 peptidase [Xylella fastidiosa subsp. multiplex]MRU31518.1 peptidase [Xylella fastidiosa subsp. multiplex]